MYAASTQRRTLKRRTPWHGWDAVIPTAVGVEPTAVGAVAHQRRPIRASSDGHGIGECAVVVPAAAGLKSIDAGATWQLMGLPDSQHIGRIVIHPTNPNIVYVAAMGHLFSRNEERGVFRTTDGGATWKKVLYVNDGVGAIDIVINRQAPAMLYAAMYDKDRRPWQIVESGPESGIYKTENGGDRWDRLTACRPARSAASDSTSTRRIRRSHALLENQNRGSFPPAAGAASAGQCAGALEKFIAPLMGIIGNERTRTDDGGKTWKKTTDVNVVWQGAVFVQPDRVTRITTRCHDQRLDAISRDGGKTWDMNFSAGFGDFRCMWWIRRRTAHRARERRRRERVGRRRPDG
jgi:photosystem II stability/assembly factor-like uncharacterized protein